MKPSKPVEKKAKSGTQAQKSKVAAKAAAPRSAKKAADGVKAKAARAAKPEPVKRRAAALPYDEDGMAFGEAEAPPQSFGQDRSRQKAKFRELSWAQFETLVQGLSQEISRKFKPDAVVGVAHGGVFVGGAVARTLGCEFFPVRISRRSRDKQEPPSIYGAMPAELKDRRVLIVDDVASSGDTLELAQALAQKVGARDVATACLVAKENGYEPGWTAVRTDELVVFPWDYGPIVEERRY